MKMFKWIKKTFTGEPQLGSRSETVTRLTMKFNAEHMDWVFSHISSPKMNLSAQVPIVLSGLYYDVISSGLPVKTFFRLLRESVVALAACESAEMGVLAALVPTRAGKSADEASALQTIHQRITETFGTAMKSGLSLSQFADVWEDVVNRFEKTATK